MGDLLTTQGNVFISAENKLEIVGPAIEDFVAGSDGSYRHVFEGVRSASAGEEDENGSEYLVPAVRFIVKTGLDLLAHEEVDYQLPREVEERCLVAYEVARNLTAIPEIRQAFRDGYEATGITDPGDTDIDFAEDDTADGIGDLSTAVFGDVRVLAGGALKLLKDKKLAEGSETAVIQRSYGLLRMARVMDLSLPHVHNELGKPYTEIRHLRTDSEADKLKVRFTDEIIKQLEAKGYLGGDGLCPAAKIKAVSVPGTILQEDWRSVSGFLVPADATVNNYREDK